MHERLTSNMATHSTRIDTVPLEGLDQSALSTIGCDLRIVKRTEQIERVPVRNDSCNVMRYAFGKDINVEHNTPRRNA